LLVRQKTGYLSTLSVEDGAPFGSIVNFAIDPASNEVFFVASKLAEHFANLEHDKRASLLISEEQVSHLFFRRGYP
jgi:putative heme iron utilization protein